MIVCPFDYGDYRSDLNLLICRPEGKLTADQMNDVAICRECIESKGLVQVNRFHDLRAITSIDLRFEDVRRICETEVQLRMSEPPITACYLVPNPLLYGTIRMYKALIESRGVDVHVSYEVENLAGILGVEKTDLVP